MRTSLAALAAAGLIAMAGCTAAPQASPTPPSTATAPDPASAAGAAMLTQFGLQGLTAQQIVEKLDHDTAARPLPLRASVRPDHLLIGDGTTEMIMPLTSERPFYLSIAPYENKTHDCHYHSLATCQGELVETPVRVEIKDASGTVLVDEETATYANGFVGFWLPANTTGTVTVTANGKSGTAVFSSVTATDATCLTTLRLR